MSFHYKHTYNHSEKKEHLQNPNGACSWKLGADEWLLRFQERAQMLARKSRQLERELRQTSSTHDDVKMTDPESEDEEMKEPIHGSLWEFGDEEKKSGCSLLARIIREFAKMRWDPLNASGPFPNCIMLGLSFLINLVSEQIMDFILDILRWWQDEDVSLRDWSLPQNSKQLKRDKLQCLPDLSQFVGMCFT